MPKLDDIFFYTPSIGNTEGVPTNITFNKESKKISAFRQGVDYLTTSELKCA